MEPQGPYYTGLAAWMMRLGIKVIYARPRQPQTKGKNERFNGTLQAELLNYTRFSGWSDARRRFHRWRRIYNTERPHQALDYRTPASRYQPSSIDLPSELAPITYGPDDTLRKVNYEGRIRFKASAYGVGKAFKGQHVALRRADNPNILTFIFVINTFEPYIYHQNV